MNAEQVNANNLDVAGSVYSGAIRSNNIQFASTSNLVQQTMQIGTQASPGLLSANTIVLGDGLTSIYLNGFVFNNGFQIPNLNNLFANGIQQL
jgi:hypothetical protein